MITAVWTGKITPEKVEVKIVLKGADLTGTTCYYESPNIYTDTVSKDILIPAPGKLCGGMMS